MEIINIVSYITSHQRLIMMRQTQLKISHYRYVHSHFLKTEIASQTMKYWEVGIERIRHASNKPINNGWKLKLYLSTTHMMVSIFSLPPSYGTCLSLNTLYYISTSITRPYNMFTICSVCFVIQSLLKRLGVSWIRPHSQLQAKLFSFFYVHTRKTVEFIYYVSNKGNQTVF